MSWAPLIAAYRWYVRDLRDRERIAALGQAGEQTGFGAAVDNAFREVCRGQMPDSEVSLELCSLDSAERIDLLRAWFELCAPIRTVGYPPRGPISPDNEVAELGISVDALLRLGANHPPLARVFAYHEAVLRERRITLASPLTQRPLTSSASLLVLAGSGRPMIAFHFIDQDEPFFLFINTFSGCFSGLLFPERDLMVSLPREAPRAMALFRALVTEFSGETVKHLTYDEKRPLALLTGTMNHVGHSVLNEYEAYHQCIQAGLFDGVDVLLRGWASFTPHTELFPELAQLPVIEARDAVAGYRAVVEGRYLVTRPTCNLWFSVGLSERLRSAACRWIEAQPSSDLREAQQRWPLLWIEVRSHDRRWVDQEDQLPLLIDHLAGRFPGLAVIMAGWSRMVDRHPIDEKMITSDSLVVQNVSQRTTSGVPIFDITGVATLEKLAWAQASDAFVCTLGTGLVFPCYVGENPGVVHTNSGYTRTLQQSPRGELRVHPADYSDRLDPMVQQPVDVRVIGVEHIVDADADQRHDVGNHYLDWRPVFDELAPMLSALPRR